MSERECMHTPVIADSGDTICKDCDETLCYGEPEPIGARIAELTRNGRLDGMTACDRCYMPKYRRQAVPMVPDVRSPSEPLLPDEAHGLARISVCGLSGHWRRGSYGTLSWQVLRTRAVGVESSL